MTKKVTAKDLYDKEAIDKRVRKERALSSNREDYPDARDCYKCDGSGFIEAFVHINDGVCYACWGLGFISRRWTMKYFNDHLGETCSPEGGDR
jgi:hypothetical protein